jgi:hypothetical protein
MSRHSILTRQELYERVWTTPMTQLALEYGLSDNGLRKICIRHDIPLPKRGYWAKKQYGKPIKRKPLKPASDPEVETICITVYDKEIRKPEAINDPKLLKIIQYENNPKNRIRVPKRSSGHNALVEKTRKSLLKMSLDQFGRYERNHQSILPVSVSPNALGRGLRIMEALLKAFDKRKYNYEIIKNRISLLSVEIMDEKISISLIEKVSREPYTPTKEEKLKAKKSSYFDWRKHHYQTIGKLQLNIDGYSSGIKKQWNDTEKTPLEECLNLFMIELVKAALVQRKRNIEREEEERIWHARHMEYLRQVELQKQEEEKRQKLIQDAENYQRAELIRRYISARTISVILQDNLDPLDSWRSWAEAVADDLDPTSIAGNDAGD